ncbi:MAG: hypothetical protein KJ626_03395 [Verrucomicrobia bacterium]|nr:hypothetical protein [Verrucomicrobiota bacterium]
MMNRAINNFIRVCAAILLCGSVRIAGAEVVCATVQIEIQQTLTLERQAFDATMKIHNGFADIPLTDVSIVVNFEDEDGNAVTATSDPDNTSALFFIREDELDRIDNTSAGTVAGGDSAEIHWLIIPAIGAGGSNELGQVYLVGATLTYNIRDQENTTEVIPDGIRVKPMPKLSLDYFLPDQVLGDDPFTTAIEAPVPYNLGLRVLNAGYGPAYNLKLESAQPEIVDNEQGLLIGFELTGSEVNGASGGSSLLVDFGTVDAHDVGVARWTMTSSLSGRFTDFDAYFTHADELGGELTSLIEDVTTHTLIHDVLADLPGRDAVRDFLAREDDESIHLYESEPVDSVVTDRSGSAALTLTGSSGDEYDYEITVPVTAGPLYAGVDFPDGAEREIVSATRDDGKVISLHNVWISKRRDHGTDPWEYQLHLFDINGGGTYYLNLRRKELPENQAPVLGYIGRKVTFADQNLGFLVTASDPDGTIPVLSVTGMPANATFTDEGDGTGTFDWTPTGADWGVHPVRFMASDTEFSDWEVIRIYVGHAGEGVDAQGLPLSLSNWEPEITDLMADTSSGTATVLWDSVEGVYYEVYSSDNPFDPSSVWSRIGVTEIGDGGMETQSDTGLGTDRSRRYYRLVLAGEDPDSNKVWGVIRKELPHGYTMMAPPVRGDLRFDGELGAALGDVLSGDSQGFGDGVGDEIYILQADGSWRILYLDGNGVWRESDGSVSTEPIDAGRGFFVARHEGVTARATFAGPVGNDGSHSISVSPGWNMIGLSEGKDLPVEDLFADVNPVGGPAEELADQIVIQRVDGSWRFLFYVDGWGPPYDGHWFDFDTYDITTYEIQPGDAVYYFRQSSGGSMEVPF